MPVNMNGATHDSGPAKCPDLNALTTNRRWWFRAYPFAHFHARDIFSFTFYDSLKTAFQEILDRGLSQASSTQRFSQNMTYSDSFAWAFPPDISGPLSIFYSREWHGLVQNITGVQATRDVNAALHHHPPGSH